MKPAEEVYPVKAFNILQTLGIFIENLDSAFCVFGKSRLNRRAIGLLKR